VRRWPLFPVWISYTSFLPLTIPSREVLKKKGRAKEVLSEPKAIVEALSGEDAERTKEAIKIHLTNSKLAALECRR